MADLDHFKRVNDDLGHPAGDKMLQSFAGQMRRLSRAMDTPARLGGEEFALLLPEIPKHDAFLVAERLRRAVRTAFADSPVPLTVSIGVASWPDDGATADDLLRAGDQALYAAKQVGRDRSVLFNAELVMDLARGDQQEEGPRPVSCPPSSCSPRPSTSGTPARHSTPAVAATPRRRDGARAPPARGGAPRALAGVCTTWEDRVADRRPVQPGPLDDEEWAQVRKHPELGARLLAGAGLGDVAEWVFAHHEQLDGSGYPLGLESEEIPLEARMLAVADAYEAMTSERPYSAALSHADAAADCTAAPERSSTPGSWRRSSAPSRGRDGSRRRPKPFTSPPVGDGQAG